MGDEGAHPWKPSCFQASEEHAKIAPSTRAECGAQYAALDEGIRTVPCMRNTCLRAGMERLPEGKNFEALGA